jgi:hypothetical protein
MRPHPLALVEHGGAIDGRKPFHDEPQRFAGGVGVDGAETVDRQNAGL